MKHIFIINPAAGKENSYEEIQTQLLALADPVDFEIYQTAAPGDATSYVRQYCQTHTEPVRFYACGGDGTLNEVVNGVVGFPHASLSCYPCGSGNDFVKYYGGKKFFFNLDELVHAKEEYIDLMRVGDRYAINATHFGFDSCVAKTMMNVRRKKLIGGKNAYTTGVVVGLVKAMKNPCRVTVDGELLNPGGTILLCTIANGQFVGGSFRCAPRSVDNDGLLEVCLVRPVSYVTFLRLIGEYSKGTHLDDPRFEKYLEYRRGKTVHIEAPEGFLYSLDGELYPDTDFTVEVVPGAVRFGVPASARPLPGDWHEAKTQPPEVEDATLVEA
ncbi:MAG: diacylglycerol kinase family lipid kinase [Clostridia bacterium]|nr:diacylglycerol kinase family lipid kinase [Clostridia bacterium]